MGARFEVDRTALSSPYRTGAGKPWMRNSWVVFMDILGFSARMLTAAKAGTSNELLRELTAALSEAKEQSDLILDDEEYAKLGIKVAPYAVKMFTDNVVLGIPIRDDGEAEFSRAIYTAGLWQFRLLMHGFFVRGGITVGPIYMDADVAFGAGLLAAYEAESKLAGVPRIVLDRDAMNLVHQHLAYYTPVSESPQNFTLLVDSDSQMFVNYLYLPIDDGEETPRFLKELEHHRNTIIERMKEFSSNSEIWIKYAWAAAYHNYFCDHLPEAHDLKIESSHFMQPVPRSVGEIYETRDGKVYQNGKEVAKWKSLSEWKVERPPDSPGGVT